MVHRLTVLVVRLFARSVTVTQCTAKNCTHRRRLTRKTKQDQALLTDKPTLNTGPLSSLGPFQPCVSMALRACTESGGMVAALQKALSLKHNMGKVEIPSTFRTRSKVQPQNGSFAAKENIFGLPTTLVSL
jgi:hypothetical protein